MECHTIFPGSKTYRDVRRLYLSAFPPEERRSLFSLWLLSTMRPGVSLDVYLDKTALCGFSLTVDSEKYLYISFIAVDPALRGKGCGSQMLEHLHQSHPGKAMLVEVEAPEETASNYTQRVKRIAFYQRNGFYDLNRTITGRGVTYRLLSTDPDFDREAYRRIFDQLSFGLRARLKQIRQKLTGNART